MRQPDVTASDFGHLRLEGQTSQSAFRAMLDSLARPGRVVPLGDDLAAREMPTVLVPALALVTADTSFAIIGTEAATWALLVADVTGGRIAALEDADLVVVLDGLQPELLLGAKRGTALAPEDGARLVLPTASLDQPSDSPRRFELCGPGVDGMLPSDLGGLSPAVVEARNDAVAKYPAGIDLWLADTGGRLLGLPRSTWVQLAEGRS